MINSQQLSRDMDVKKSLFIHLFTVLTIHCILADSSTSGTNITTDQFSLMALKARVISDPYGVLENWTVPSSVCNWIGITCGKRHHRVVALNMSSMGLTGSIPPELGNLSFLVSLDIRRNNFGQTVPEDLVRLRRLRLINLGLNNFAGAVPSWFSSLPLQYLSVMNNSFTSVSSFIVSSTNKSKLATLDVSFNHIQEEIPKSIGNMQNLRVLVIQGNGFSGVIPPSIMNLSSLQVLAIAGNSFQGSMPATIFNISTLRLINLFKNNFSGTVPSRMCLGLPMLEEFGVSYNQIGGQIPSNLSSCTKLKRLSFAYNIMSGAIPSEIATSDMLEYLYLGGNKFTGAIPPDIGKLHNLVDLGLERNLFTGSIPLTIFNLSFLQDLNLATNKFSGFLADKFGNLTELKTLYLTDNSFIGVVPQGFDKLTKLEALGMDMNGLSGPLPSFIFNISTLRILSFTLNRFSGNLPTDIGTFLPSLEILDLSGNKLYGIVPNSISNSSLLKFLFLEANQLTGVIPNSLRNLKFLTRLSLSHNNFSVDSKSSSELTFITSLTSSKYLEVLRISDNPLNGFLPTSVGNLSSTLQDFFAFECNIKGYIPNEFGNLSGLVRLYLQGNELTGVIPTALHKLSNLQVMDLSQNQLTGFMPNDICKLNNLGIVSLGQNQLTGSIPKCMGNVSSLRYIRLNSNNFTSGIPESIWSMQNLLELNISSNLISGPLSPQIGNLKAAVSIDLSVNQISNEIPDNFANLQGVSYLSIAHNALYGPIPDSIGSMLNLISLDLSHNKLSGTIPKSLESLTLLEDFNVSFNELSGQIPKDGPFRNFTSKSFAFNTALCGPPKFQVPPCKEPLNWSKKKKILLGVFIILGVGTLLLIVTVAFLMVRRRRKNNSPTTPNIPDTTMPRRMSYYELLKVTNGLSEGNLLGKGSLSSVYRGDLEDGTILAIKVFNMLLEVASKTFYVECDALRNLRHRNLIKVVSSCSNEDFKAIVLEYMPNGSLEKWLYSDNHVLDIMQRLNIMIDVASALEYLHHGYSTAVVHCDLKPSNVLMDENMVAHVSDFGITKFLAQEESTAHTRTLATLGYMAPEYGSGGRVSIRGDVYSYGIMLLETFTRKRPSDEMFSEDTNLKNWVKDSLPNALSQVIDEKLISPDETYFGEKLGCASSVMELALRCCVDSPHERMNMKDVHAELKKIKAKFLLHQPGTSNMRRRQNV